MAQDKFELSMQLLLDRGSHTRPTSIFYGSTHFMQ